MLLVGVEVEASAGLLPAQAAPASESDTPTIPSALPWPLLFLAMNFLLRMNNQLADIHAQKLPVTRALINMLSADSRSKNATHSNN